MCGRFVVMSPRWQLEGRFKASMSDAETYHPNYNVAPSQSVPVVLSSAPEEITLVHWGYIPHWMKDPMKAKPMINARGETVAEKPYFRDSFNKRRCLILTDGFYEWDRKGGEKVPYFITLQDSSPFAFAGIWDTVKEQDGKEYPTVAIVTTSANDLVGKIHDRMPVILNAKDEHTWLDEGLPTEDAVKLLQPYDVGALKMYEVSREVNKVSYNKPEAIEPVNA